MTAAELNQEHPTTREVVGWRFEQLLAAGFEIREARVVARRRDIDLHQALELIARGCPPELALSILL